MKPCPYHAGMALDIKVVKWITGSALLTNAAQVVALLLVILLR